jgi:hypothetical protein
VTIALSNGTTTASSAHISIVGKMNGPPVMAGHLMAPKYAYSLRHLIFEC